MLKTELLKNNTLIKHYSDTRGMGVLQIDTNIIYSEAIDVNPTNHTYEEVPLEIVDDETYQGTKTNPILYNGNMILEEGKYYMQNDVVYKCTHNSDVIMFQELSELLGLYVEKE